MKSTLILTATSLLAAVAVVHGGVIEVSPGATGSTQNPSGTASVSSSASYASSTPGKQRESHSTGVHTLSIMSPQGACLPCHRASRRAPRPAPRQSSRQACPAARPSRRHLSPRRRILLGTEEVELLRSNTYDSVFVTDSLSLPSSRTFA
ncbi:hypothetical protein EDB86DRAFT_1947241 [Lactarius hatsudake]|nr:hypothetical protein EDB86DRAFT_1947241 [Lactarius hatsudake]